MDIAMTAGSTKEYKRAQVLLMLIMMAAGNFVEKSLQWDGKRGMWESSRRCLRSTNLDVITAEAIVWIAFLIGQLWKADQKQDHEMFLRVGFTTTSTAGQMGLEMIESQTGVDFRSQAMQRRRFYMQTAKDGSNLVDPFASVVLRSIGCRSLTEPWKEIGPLSPPVLTPIAIVVSIFLTTMPPAIYDTFKNILREYSDRFPSDEEFDD